MMTQPTSNKTVQWTHEPWQQCNASGDNEKNGTVKYKVLWTFWRQHFTFFGRLKSTKHMHKYGPCLLFKQWFHPRRNCPPWKSRTFCCLFQFPLSVDDKQEIAIKPPHLAFSMANTWQDIHIKICRLLYSLGCNSHYIPLCTAVLKPARILLLTLNTHTFKGSDVLCMPWCTSDYF